MANTTYLNIEIPDVGADNNTWGTITNAAWNAFDACLRPTGNGTSVGLNVGAGNTLTVAGTLTATGTVTLPGTATAGTSVIATLTNTQTLTNKTLTSPVITSPDINGTASVEAVTATTITDTSLALGQNDDWAPTGFATASFVRVNSSNVSSITGIAGGAAGRIIYLSNVSSNQLTLQFEASGSIPANRLSGVADLALLQNEGCTLIYDGTSSRWRVVGLYKGS